LLISNLEHLQSALLMISKNGGKEFTALREKGESHQIEKVGRELRKMFSWMKKADNDDYQEGSAARG
jgi:ketol-acid reductoisomerase